MSTKTLEQPVSGKLSAESGHSRTTSLTEGCLNIVLPLNDLNSTEKGDRDAGHSDLTDLSSVSFLP